MTGSALHWGIKSSLLTYVSDIPDVGVEFSEGTSGDLSAGFRFPVTESSWSGPGDTGVVRALGTVTLRGYGTQICQIDSPVVSFAGEHGTLSVRRWPTREAMLDLAVLDGTPAAVGDRHWRWSQVRLLAPGREIFDFRYDDGAELAALDIRLASGA